jgi:hypothetical protein
MLLFPENIIAAQFGIALRELRLTLLGFYQQVNNLFSRE